MNKFSAESYSARAETSKFANMRRPIALVLAGFAGGLGLGRHLYSGHGQAEGGVLASMEAEATRSDVGEIEILQGDFSSGLVGGSAFDQSPEDFVDPSQCRVLNVVVQGREKTIDEMRQLVDEADRLEIQEIEAGELEQFFAIQSELESYYKDVDWVRLFDDYKSNPEFIDYLRSLAERASQRRLNEEEKGELRSAVDVLAFGVENDPQGKGWAWEIISNLKKMEAVISRM